MLILYDNVFPRIMGCKVTNKILCRQVLPSFFWRKSSLYAACFLDKNRKNPCWFSEPSACCGVLSWLYENEFSTAKAKHYNSVATRHSENHQTINHKNSLADTLFLLIPFLFLLFSFFLHIVLLSYVQHRKMKDVPCTYVYKSPQKQYMILVSVSR